MQGLPPKPDFPARPPAQTSDDRRASGGRSSPDRYVPRDDWRDRDQRSYRPRDPPRSPRPIMDSYIAGSLPSHPDAGSPPPPPPRGSSPHPPQRDSWMSSGSPAHHHRGDHGRDYRHFEDPRARGDDRERRPHAMRDQWRSGRVDHWTPGRDRNRDRENDRRKQDNHEYRRAPHFPGRRRPYAKDDWRDQDRDKDRDRDRERDDRRYERRHPSPDYRRDSRSPPPRRDHYSGRGHSPAVRRHPCHSPPRGYRSPSPHHIKPDSASEHETPRRDRDRDWVRERKSISPPPRRRRYSRSPSPYRRQRPRQRSPSASRARPTSPRQRSPSPSRYPREPVDDAGVEATEERRPSPLPPIQKEEEREENRQGLSPHRHGMKEGSPAESTHVKRQLLSPPRPSSGHGHARRSFSPTASEKEKEREKEREREVEKKPTQPYLPVIPRYNPGPPFSKALLVGADYDRFDAYRVHVASEQCKAGKAWRRAVHELEMATLELKTAQSRRELAEGLRKRAHAGLLGIGATTPGDAVSV